MNRESSLTVIEASAGTGKTFRLVTRLMALIFGGVAPERIVALTFSRLAAGEIFNSFIERLAKAASDEATAREESDRLGRALGTADFAAKLREVIARQHLSQIGTLDSFLVKIVRMMPFELGLTGEFAVMSDYRSPVERTRLLGELLTRVSPAAADVFRQAFSLAFGHSGAKGFLDAFSKFIESWHQRYRDLAESGADAAAWGDPRRIWGDEPPPGLDVTIADIRRLAGKLEGLRGKRGVGVFIDKVASFAGAAPKSLPKCLVDEPIALEAFEKMRRWKIASALARTQGIFLLMDVYERAYSAKVRARGLVTFDDLPRLINAMGEGARQAVEYRLDASFGHWALDEFQDTSRGQWRAIENLIDEASSSPDGSVFIVGDRKQSIYEWRGGDVSILGEMVRKAEEMDARESLDTSYRYVGLLSDAINRVFSERAVQGALDMDGAPERAVWRCRPHESKNASATGYVSVVEADRRSQRSSASDFFKPVKDALCAVKPWERGISTAILVRQNAMGLELLRYLKAEGVSRVVFEGDAKLTDCPAVSAMAALVTLAEHAADQFAYWHVACSPLARALYPDGLPEPSVLSAALLADFTRLGLVRKFREVREALKTVPDSWNAFTESRFEDFVTCAAEFESTRDAGTRLSDFGAFLAHRTRRDFAEPGMVRILTMHKSKGLGFDWVILPLHESDGLDGGGHVGPLESRSPRWILAHPGKDIAASDGVLAAAERERRQLNTYASLCLYYVAMTRAKRALTLILQPPTKESSSEPKYFSDLVRHSGLATSGDPKWYGGFAPVSAPSGEAAQTARTPRARRERVRKLRPSESVYDGLRADVLFGEDAGEAAARGTRAHERYERIEWLAPADAKDAFDRAFVRPEGVVGLWRERSYELFSDGTWETGCFDRVVFLEKNGAKRAVVYDFKTNARRARETPEAFGERMRARYAGQMEAYRRALSALTGLPAGAIDTVLLLEATRTAVAVQRPSRDLSPVR